AAGLLHRVAVHPQHRHVGEPRSDLRLELLRAESGIANPLELALRAMIGRLDDIIAVVTDRLVLGPVMCERDATVGALYHRAARGTLNAGGKAAAVEQQDHLPLLAQRQVDRLVQLSADRPARRTALKLGAQVNRRHVWQRSGKD